MMSRLHELTSLMLDEKKKKGKRKNIILINFVYFVNYVKIITHAY
jgi:hypothetical protein